MDSLPLASSAQPAGLTHLQLIAHYTGTTLRLQENELAIEGYSDSLVSLAKRILGYNIEKSNPSVVQMGSVVSSTETEKPAYSKPSPVPEPITICLEEVTSTTDGDLAESTPGVKTSTTIQKNDTRSEQIDVLTVPDEEEEETLRQIFYGTKNQDYIELKLGKNMTVGPGDERSLTLSLKQKLTKKYILHTHFEFEQFQDKLELVLELVNGTNVLVDLKNVSSAPVSLKADQNIVLLEERVSKVTQPEKKKFKKSPILVKKKVLSLGGIKNPAMVNAHLLKPQTDTRLEPGSSKPELQPSPVKPSAEVQSGEPTSLRRYNVKLQESIEIPSKNVSYAEVLVENGDDHVYGKVHEIIRHPDFKSSAIFIPERQKKKICRDEKLHMSIRNRLDIAKHLVKGKVVGQIIVRVKSGKKRENETKSEITTKKRKLSEEDGKISPTLTRPGAKGTEKDKSKILALFKQAIIESPSTLTATKVQDISGVKVIELDGEGISR